MKSVFLTLLYIFGIFASLTYGTKCGRSEYLSAAEKCCPLCAKGSVVMKDCHGDNNTTCKPCSKGTFMNRPNGFHNCRQCKICVNGLFISQDCTTMKDTVCGVLDGYYCRNYTDDRNDCSLAIKHRKCKAGEQINTPGTMASDTVCEPCSPGFYSPEGVICSKWTDCSVRNEIEDEEGTSIKDVQCKPQRNRYGLIAAFPTAAALVLVAFCLRKRKSFRSICAALTCGTKCRQNEYLSEAEECCPLCAKGSVVMKDCHGDYNTTCKPCSKGTFMIGPNGFHTCHRCKICVNGLFISQDCTTIKDTVCGVLDGYYCKHFVDDRNDCFLAIKHSKCKPGEQINTPACFILKSPVEETDPRSSQCAPSTSPLKDIQETESPAVQADCNKEYTVQVKT